MPHCNALMLYNNAQIGERIQKSERGAKPLAIVGLKKHSIILFTILGRSRRIESDDNCVLIHQGIDLLQEESNEIFMSSLEKVKLDGLL